MDEDSVPVPRQIPGVEGLNPRTIARHNWWLLRHVIQQPLTAAIGIVAAASVGLVGLTVDPVFAVVMLASSVAVVVAGFPLSIAFSRRPVRGFFTKDAGLLVRVSKNGWKITDFVARRRGAGFGADLRARVQDHLLAQADASGIEIELTTRHPKLREMYAQVGFIPDGWVCWNQRMTRQPKRSSS